MTNRSCDGWGRPSRQRERLTCTRHARVIQRRSFGMGGNWVLLGRCVPTVPPEDTECAKGQLLCLSPSLFLPRWPSPGRETETAVAAGTLTDDGSNNLTQKQIAYTHTHIHTHTQKLQPVICEKRMVHVRSTVRDRQREPDAGSIQQTNSRSTWQPNTRQVRRLETRLKTAVERVTGGGD